MRDFLANPVPPRYPRVSNWRPRVVVCEKPFSTATRPPESSQPLFVVATNFNHNLLYLLIWFHAHRPNVELSTGFSETERVRPQEDRIIDSVRTEFLCPQLPTAGKTLSQSLPLNIFCLSFTDSKHHRLQSSSSLEKYATLKQPMGGAISHDQSAHVNFYRGFHSFLTCDVCNDDKSARVVRCSTPHSLLHEHV